MTDRSDPLSTALACVRRLSDEGLDALWDAISREQEERALATALAARWFAGRTRGGYLPGRPRRVGPQGALRGPGGPRSRRRGAHLPALSPRMDPARVSLSPRKDPTPGERYTRGQGDLFPVVGETLEHGGITWRVVEREPAHVVFRVEGMPSEPARRIGLRQWQRVAERSAR